VRYSIASRLTATPGQTPFSLSMTASSGAICLPILCDATEGAAGRCHNPARALDDRAIDHLAIDRGGRAGTVREGLQHALRPGLLLLGRGKGPVDRSHLCGVYAQLAAKTQLE